MVKITGFQKRTASDGRVYFVLELQSDDLELIVSKNTGKYYATVRKAFMSTAFDDSVCMMMIGKELKGSIKKESCEPYSIKVPDTDETITLNYRNYFLPIENGTMEDAVIGEKVFEEA